MSYFKSISPYTNEAFHLVDKWDSRELELTIEKAHSAFQKWRIVSYSERRKSMEGLLASVKDQQDLLAEIATQEMGKPIREAIGEVKKCADLIEYFIQSGSEALTPRFEEDNTMKATISKEPMGPILGIMPWNFPFWQVFRFAVPNLLLGNTVLLKHAPQTMGCSEHLEQLFLQHFPQGCYTHLPISEDLIKTTIANPLVHGVSLTGGTAAGRAVGQLAGKYLKKSVLELGGNNAYLIFPDCDINLAVRKCVLGRFMNTGQSCIAAKRIIIHPQIQDQFTQLFLEKVDQLKIGDPSDPSTHIGPMARLELAEKLDVQIQKTISDGAIQLRGGNRRDCFIPPTVLAGLTPDMHLAQEEGFGPVACLYYPKSEKDMWAWAKDTQYGLGTAIFTQAESTMQQAEREILDSALFINEIVKSDPRLPFGGIRNSGYGRELGPESFLEFANIKTVYKAKF